MPRPTSIADGVGFAESPAAVPVKRPAPSKFNPVIWGESQQFVWRRGGVPEQQVLWVSNPKKRRMAWLGGCVFVVGFASLFVSSIPDQFRAVPCMVCACVGLALFAATTSWSDARIGGVRFVRVAPLRRVRAALAAESPVSGKLAEAAMELLAERRAHRATLTRMKRASDGVASPAGLRLMIAGQLVMYLAMLILPLTTLVPAARGALWLTLPAMVVGVGGMCFFGWRTSASRRVDERQRAGSCPDCGYEVGGLGDDPALNGLVPGCGPASCPECGVKYPLVPPPTPHEVMEGNRPDAIR